MNRKDRKFGIGSIVIHFKGGVYRIEEFARNTETSELMVVYRELRAPYYCYAMEEERFCSLVDHQKYPNATRLYRFEKLSKEEAVEYDRQRAN